MKNGKLKRVGIALLSIAVATPIGLAAPASSAPADIKVGVITSTSGPLKSFGDAYVDGLEWGLNYFTKGTMRVNGAKIVLTKKDDGGVPDSAIASFKEMVGSGHSIIAGTASSAIALGLAPLAQQNKTLYISGPAKNDGITTAANKYVFRSGNTSLQDFAPLSGLRPIRGQKVLLFVEDNAFGLGNIAAAKAYLGPQGATFEEIKVPMTTTEFTPFAKQAADAKARYIFIAWSNTLNSAAMFTSLRQQGVFQVSRPVTGLADVATYNVMGAIFEGTNAVLTSSYFPGVGKSTIASALASDYAKSGKKEGLFTPDGVNAAQMIIRALRGNVAPYNVDKAISNLEGFSFIGLKGQMTVDRTKHYLIQPMYLASLNRSADGSYKPALVRTIFNVKA
jgi:branched-chain amino acid transport system substrate-binding protein